MKAKPLSLKEVGRVDKIGDAGYALYDIYTSYDRAKEAAAALRATGKKARVIKGSYSDKVYVKDA